MTASGGPSRSYTTALDGGDIRAEKARIRWAWAPRQNAHLRPKLSADLLKAFIAIDFANAISPRLCDSHSVLSCSSFNKLSLHDAVLSLHTFVNDVVTKCPDIQ